MVVPLQVSPQQPSASINIGSSQVETARISVDPESEWEEIDWDDVTLSDILGETDEYFEEPEVIEKEYGDS